MRLAEYSSNSYQRPYSPSAANIVHFNINVLKRRNIFLTKGLGRSFAIDAKLHDRLPRNGVDRPHSSSEEALNSPKLHRSRSIAVSLQLYGHNDALLEAGMPSEAEKKKAIANSVLYMRPKHPH